MGARGISQTFVPANTATMPLLERMLKQTSLRMTYSSPTMTDGGLSE